MMTIRILCLLLSLLASVAADHIATPDFNLDNLVCDLECHHNGVCRFLTKDPHDMQNKMQSGHMVQHCLCPLGHHGLSCDIPDDFQSDAGDCAIADSLSKFAGEQCRKPYTEYCSSLAESVGGHLSFCTHGGKCRGAQIAAKESPWDTKNNFLFQ